MYIPLRGSARPPREGAGGAVVHAQQEQQEQLKLQKMA